METTYNNLNDDEILFFQKLKNYIDCPIYFFGSIQRFDFLPNFSDIDLLIFYQNKNSFLTKLYNFFYLYDISTFGANSKPSYQQISSYKIKKTIYKINNSIFYGYKIKYKNNNFKRIFNIEISCYDIKYKSYILDYEKLQIYLPFYITLLLFIIKYLFSINIISKNFYIKSKKYIINNTFIKTITKTKFIVL
jgi:predicted nucleotidyltransferase